MTPAALIFQLNAVGVELFSNGAGLRYRAPIGALTPELRQLVAEQRNEIIAHFRAAAEIELAEERAAIESEETASPESTQFELNKPAAPPKSPHFEEWIERVGADGRCGWDKPGQLTARRWWERIAIEPENHKSVAVGDSCPRCNSSDWRDVAIHDGKSTRRDCDRCGKFIGFPIWHVVPAT